MHFYWCYVTMKNWRKKPEAQFFRQLRLLTLPFIISEWHFIALACVFLRKYSHLQAPKCLQGNRFLRCWLSIFSTWMCSLDDLCFNCFRFMVFCSNFFFYVIPKSNRTFSALSHPTTCRIDLCQTFPTFYYKKKTLFAVSLFLDLKKKKFSRPTHLLTY